MSTIPETMKLITQEQVNKACHSRNYAILDDMRMRIKLELLAAQEEFDLVENPTRQQKFNLKVIKLNLERIEDRIADLAARSLKKSEREIERKQQRMMALALIGQKAQTQNLKQEVLNAKYIHSDEHIQKHDPEMWRIIQAQRSGVSLEEHAAKLRQQQQQTEYKFATTEEVEAETAKAIANAADTNAEIFCSNCPMTLTAAEAIHSTLCTGCINVLAAKERIRRDKALMDDIAEPTPTATASTTATTAIVSGASNVSKLIPKVATKQRLRDVFDAAEMQKIRNEA